MDISDLSKYMDIQTECKEREQTKKDKKVIANLMEVVKILEKDFGGKILQFSFDVETQEISVFGCQKRSKKND